MSAGRPVVAVLSAALLLSFTGAASAQNPLPIPGMAPGTQNGVASPFVGLVQAPGAQLYSGSATASVDIVVPPGRLDATPKLALTYSSAAGRGPYGHGWSLSVGRISRSLRLGVPSYDNGRDTFVLELPGQVVELVADGGKLYRPKYEGVHLKIGFDRQANYWKIIDPHGTRFVFGRDPARNSRAGRDTRSSSQTFAWYLERVEDPFGNDIDYFYENPAGSSLARKPDGILDRVEYGGNSARGLAHAFVVDFDWGHSELSGSQVLSYATGHVRAVDDAWTLAQVTTRLIGDSGTGAPGRTYAFGYDRDPITEVARLSAVAMTARTAGSTVELPETVFAYSPGLDLTGWPTGSPEQRLGPSAAPYPVPITSPAPNGHGFRETSGKVKRDLVDVNGDGLIDAIFLAGEGVLEVRLGTGSDFATPLDWTFPDGFNELRHNDEQGLAWNLFDIDGDGLPDFVDATGERCGASSICHFSGDCCWDVYRNNGSGFEVDPSISWNAPRNAIQESNEIDAFGGVRGVLSDTIDLDADGRPDHVLVDPTLEDAGWKIHWNTGAGFAAQAETWAPPHEPDGTPIHLLGAVRTTDATGFAPSRALYGMVDMNGDGLPDFLRADADGDFQPGSLVEHWWVWYNTGDGFTEARSWSVADGTLLPDSYGASSSTTDVFRSSRELIDITGDGLLDLVDKDHFLFHPPPGTCPSCAGCAEPCGSGAGDQAPVCCEPLAVFPGTGAGFAAAQSLPHWRPTLDLRAYTDPSSPSQYAFGDAELVDFDGDGLLDLLESDDGEWRLYAHWMSPRAAWTSIDDSSRFKPNLLVAMMNGLGGVSMLEYAPASLLPDLPCRRDSSSGDPLEGACIPFPHWVVVTIETDDALSTAPSTHVDYAYADGKYFGAQRELRGFGRAALIDAQGRTVVSEYHQDAARAGRVAGTWSLGNPDCGARARPFDPDDSCNPWAFVLGREINEWGDPLDPLDPRPVLLQAVLSVPYHGGAPRIDLSKTTRFEYDEHGNEALRRIVSADRLGAGTATITEIRTLYDRKIDTLVAGMPDRYVVARPSSIRTESEGLPLFEKRFTYRDLLYASKVETCTTWSDAGACDVWVRRQERRDALGLVTKSKPESGRKAKYRYRDATALYPTQARDGRLQSFIAHDPLLGKPVRVVDAGGANYEIVYDGVGRVLERWGPSPASGGTAAEYLLERVAYLEPVVSTGTPGSVRRDLPELAPTVTFYDGLGRPIASKTRVEVGAGVETTIVSGLVGYDEFGRPAAHAPVIAAAQSDPRVLDRQAEGFGATAAEERTTTAYDVTTGKRTRVEPPHGATVELEYRVPGLELVRDASAAMQVRRIDALGRVVRTERCVDTIDFDLVTPDYECPRVHRRERIELAYDGLGRLTGTSIQQIEAAGQPMQWLAAIEYDGLGNRTRVRRRNAGEWNYRYDDRGQLESIVAPDGVEQRMRYRRARLVRTSVTGPEPGSRLVIERSYVAKGLGAGRLEVVSVEDRTAGSDYSKSLTYTARGAVATETITIASRVDDETFRSSHTIERSYDGANRPFAVTYPGADPDHGGPAARAVRVGYNGAGQAVSLTGDADRTFVEDVDYDIYGNTVAVRYGNGVDDRYVYAPQSDGGRLACKRTGPGDTSGDACAPQAFDYRAVAYQRDVLGRVTLVDDLLNDGASAHSFHQRIEYDDIGRVVAAAYRELGSIAIDEDRYAYDSLGRIVERTRSVGGEGVSTIAYGYPGDAPDPDPDGSVSPLHRLTSYGAVPLRYDRSGRRTQKGGLTYEYDGLGRLQRVQSSSGTIALNHHGEGDARISKHTPADSRLVHYFSDLFEVHIDTATHDAWLVRHYSLGTDRVASDRSPAPDGLVVVATLGDRYHRRRAAGARPMRAAVEIPLGGPKRRADAIAASFAARHLGLATLTLAGGACAFALLSFVDRRRTALATASLLIVFVLPLNEAASPAHAQFLPDDAVFYHTDHLGSVQLITDLAGDVVEQLRYRVYGALRGVFGPAPVYAAEQPPDPETGFGYGGHRNEPESGLIYFGARHYDPEIAGFLTPDAAAQFASPYAYAAWDPANNVDPDGNFAVVFAAVARAIAFVTATLSAAHGLAGAFRGQPAGLVIAGVTAFAGPVLEAAGSAILRAAFPGSLQTALRLQHVASTGLATARAVVAGDAAAATQSISALAAGIGASGSGSRQSVGSSEHAAAKHLSEDHAPSASAPGLQRRGSEGEPAAQAGGGVREISPSTRMRLRARARVEAAMLSRAGDSGTHVLGSPLSKSARELADGFGNASDVFGVSAALLADVQLATVQIPPLSAGAGFLSKGAGVGSLLFAGASNRARGVSLLSGDVPAKLGAVLLGGLTSMTSRQRALDFVDALRGHALAVGYGLQESR